MHKSDEVYRVLPIYLCIDESASMEGPKLEACNKALPEIHRAIASDPTVSDIVRISVISFSDSAEVLLPLSRMTDVVDFPGLVAKGGTNYGSAFTCLKQTIQDDITTLKAKGNVQVNRPIVFFISDGEPTDTNWQTVHAAVADKTWSFSPHIISFGVGGAKEKTIRETATKIDKHGTIYAYLADDNADPSAVLAIIFNSLIQVITNAAIGRVAINELLNLKANQLTQLTPYWVPVYLVLDESSSVSKSALDAINSTFPEIHKSISVDPLINESVRVGIISFSDSAEVLLPLSKLGEVDDYPGLVAKGVANFYELFVKLQGVLIRDYSENPESIDRFARPLIFILVASNPSDESWREQRERLVTDPRFHNPHIVVLGVGEALASVMTDIATSSPMHLHPMAYRLTETSLPSDLIRESLKTLYFGSSHPNNDQRDHAPV